MIPLYKNKGDIQDCSNYRGIKLISYTMKLWEKVIEHRLKEHVKIYYGSDPYITKTY